MFSTRYSFFFSKSSLVSSPLESEFGIYWSLVLEILQITNCFHLYQQI